MLASALLLVKLTQLVRSLAQHADIYEEEDFNISANGFRFAPPVDGDGLEKAVGDKNAANAKSFLDKAKASLDEIVTICKSNKLV